MIDEPSLREHRSASSLPPYLHDDIPNLTTRNPPYQTISGTLIFSTFLNSSEHQIAQHVRPFRRVQGAHHSLGVPGVPSTSHHHPTLLCFGCGPKKLTPSLNRSASARSLRSQELPCTSTPKLPVIEPSRVLSNLTCLAVAICPWSSISVRPESPNRCTLLSPASILQAGSPTLTRITETGYTRSDPRPSIIR